MPAKIKIKRAASFVLHPSLKAEGAGIASYPAFGLQRRMKDKGRGYPTDPINGLSTPVPKGKRGGGGGGEKGAVVSLLYGR